MSIGMRNLQREARRRVRMKSEGCFLDDCICFEAVEYLWFAWR